ncbi:zinc-binding alcohol dehydrogenase family protein [Danaus plexippus plexippus]|uniref:Zinc-binding alcohol dehydrogenase family protein n=1 Tax=Danaus plexippus plexippus TaxID=278856 RepID=A0A212EPF4_DANPL|nr:zinc-binding alcohol dehydrogenase family protein [Danaus plexippus plexippus]
MLDSGVLKSTVTKVLSPIDADNLKEAHKLLESKRMIGKVVLSGF